MQWDSIHLGQGRTTVIAPPSPPSLFYLKWSTPALDISYEWLGG